MAWELFQQGGLVMYPLAICSVLALAVALERGFSLQRRRIIQPQVASVVQNIHGWEDTGLALSVCSENNGPFANVMRAGLDSRDLPMDEIREAILDQGRQEMGSLQKGLVVLETVAGVSPLLGLLGTVLGMIRVFQEISNVGVGQGNLLAGGIAEAILTTAAGLVIAIPSLVFYNYYSSKAEGLILEIESYSNLLLRKLRGFRDAAGEASHKEGAD